MSPKLQAKIVEALRSGAYDEIIQRGTKLLRDNNSYSIWGVVCDCIDNTKWKRVDNNSFYIYYGCYVSLPLFYWDTFGKTLVYTISRMDRDGLRFADIADFIESERSE